MSGNRAPTGRTDPVNRRQGYGPATVRFAAISALAARLVGLTEHVHAVQFSERRGEIDVITPRMITPKRAFEIAEEFDREEQRRRAAYLDRAVSGEE